VELKGEELARVEARQAGGRAVSERLGVVAAAAHASEGLQALLLKDGRIIACCCCWGVFPGKVICGGISFSSKILLELLRGCEGTSVG
jgi:hypothetical protein